MVRNRGIVSCALTSAGTPPTVFWADKSRVHSWSMNAAAPYLSMKPRSDTCIFFGSGIYQTSAQA
jgi:hypothetical protein